MAWAIARRVVGGRYSRGAWIAATFLYMSAISLVVLPFATFLWTSPRLLREIYVAFLIAATCLSLAGLVLAFAKRLHDQNINGLCAVAPLLAVPMALLWAAMTWARHAPEADSSVSTTAYLNVAMAVSLICILLVALRQGHEGSRFGPRTDAGGVVAVKHPAMLLLLIVVAVVAATTIYAGVVQDGIWVGRGEHEYDTGLISMPSNGGRVFATCGGAKGVSAIAQDRPGGGFVRDAVDGSWMFSIMPDGSVDILTVGRSGAVSYQSDGFAITAQGLKMDDLGQVAADVDGFQLIGSAQEPSGDVRAVTTVSFVKGEFGYQATMAASKVYGRGSMMSALSGGHPRASSFLLIADCFVSQARPPNRQR